MGVGSHGGAGMLVCPRATAWTQIAKFCSILTENFLSRHLLDYDQNNRIVNVALPVEFRHQPWQVFCFVPMSIYLPLSAAEFVGTLADTRCN